MLEVRLDTGNLLIKLENGNIKSKIINHDKIIKSCFENNIEHIVIDFKDVTFITSIDIGNLYNFYSKIRKYNIKLSFINYNKQIEKILHITKFSDILENNVG